jgi:hypothetical protein
MEKLNKVLVIVVLGLSTIMVGCKKDSSTAPDSVPIMQPPPPPPPANILCNGNGGTDYIPFATANRWVYENSLGTVTYDYQGTEVIQSQSYYKTRITNEIGNFSWVYHRYDSNGDLYELWELFTGGWAIEKVIVPGNLTIGQSWTDPNSNQSFVYTYEVISLNASVTTSSCNYTGLIQIDESLNGTVTDKRYYKKGLGEVKETSITQFGSSVEWLKSVSLN